MKRARLITVSALVLAVLAAAWIEARRPRPLIPTLTSLPEYCVVCHADTPDTSPSHLNAALGCVRCHGGERLAVDADVAHRTLRGGRNPSDLAVVEESCGGSACHSGSAAGGFDHIPRVRASLQTTYAGAIAQARYAFGLQPDLTARVGIEAVRVAEPAPGTLPALAEFNPVQDAHPALQTFAENCLACHLSAEPLPGPAYARFTGCAACHTPTAGAELTEQTFHRLTTAIPYTQCNTCHNRGNYSFRDVQFHPRPDAPTDRLHAYYQPIAQFTRCEYELDCVDCHTNGEVMGDGNLRSNQRAVQYVQCRACHGTTTEPPLARQLTERDAVALRLAFLNPVRELMAGDTILVTDKGEPLWNTRLRADGAWELIGKVSGQAWTIPLATGSACQQRPEEQASRFCHACHAVQR